MATMIKKIAWPLMAFLVITLLSSYICIFGKKEGIKGYVYRIKGNQMPSPDQPLPAKKGFQTTIYIYELTNASQVTRTEPHGTFYSTIKTKLVKQVETDKNGYFKVKLAPGQYSVFIKKGDLFYANLFDDKNNIAPVTVTKKKFTDLEVRADYDAVY